MNCNECTLYFYGYLQDAENIPVAALEHINNCAVCRDQAERLRDHLHSSEALREQNSLLRKHLRLHAGLLDQWVSCSQVRPFLPALLVEGMQVTAQTPVTAHLEHCSLCRKHLADLRSLALSREQLISAGTFMAASDHAASVPEKAGPVLQAILKTEHSGIETRMETNPSAGIRVRHSGTGTANRSRVVRYGLTGGIAAAAVLLVVTLLPTAAIGNLENVNKAVKSVSEVHLQRYSEAGSLIQEIWISKSLGFKIYKQQQRTLFKNIRSGQVVQGAPGGDAIVLSEGLRDDDMYARLLPFDQIKDLPPQYEWNFVKDDVLDGRRVHIYELTWQHPGVGVTVFKKWRAAMDTRTYLPYQIEWFERLQAEQEWVLLTRSKVQYPSKGRFVELLGDEGFQRFLTEDQVE